MLVTVDRYQTITGDDTSASGVVEAALTDAQALLEERLHRPLEQMERTERVKLFNERRGVAVYPSALPLISATDPADPTIDGAAIVGGYPLTPGWGWASGYRDVTYVGGYDPTETDSTQPDYLPRTLERAIIWAAYSDVNSSTVTSSLPAGVQSASVGDVSLNFGTAGFSPGASGEVTFSNAVIKRYRRRRDIAA